MNVGILGTGDVGRALGKGFITLGHSVKMGAREARNEKALAWAGEVGADGSVAPSPMPRPSGTSSCSPRSAWRTRAPSRWRVVIIPGQGPDRHHESVGLQRRMPPKLAVSGNDSGGEHVQRLLPDAHVVKAFNTVGNAFMFRPEFPGGPPDMFIAGNSDDAKNRGVRHLERLRLGHRRCRRNRGLAVSRGDVHGLGPVRDAHEQLESSVQAAEEVIRGRPDTVICII